MIFAVILFVATYVLLLALPKYRAVVALSSALIFILSGTIDFMSALSAINLNVIMMLAGTMGIVSLFIDSKMPSLLADIILAKVSSVKWAIIALALFAGIISAFVDNVATVLMVAPIALTLSKKLNISPVPSIIAIAISSNLQGAATLVGDTTAILMGSEANMTFFDFFSYKGKASIFWVVQAGAIACAVACYFIFRKHNQSLSDDIKKSRTVVTDYLPTILLVSMIALLIIVSFVENKPENTNGYICMGLFAIGLVVAILRKKDGKFILGTLKEIDYDTLLLLSGLFIVIAGITKAGVVDKIAEGFVTLSGDNIFLLYTLIVWASVVISAFIDNIPYVATMLPVITSIAATAGIDPTILYFGLLSGATLGGNYTPIGASANIAAIGILRKNGHEVKLWDYMKISIPTTTAAVLVGYIMIWLIWSPTL